jgi:hypothetical protein
MNTKVSNLYPFESITLPVTVPANVYSYDYVLPKSVNLDDHNFNIISRVFTSIDTAGLSNVTETEVVSVNSIDITINPGYYNRHDLTTLLNVNIPISGAYSFYTVNTFTMSFVDNSQIALILGYVNKLSPGFAISPNTRASHVINITKGLDVCNILCSLTSQASSFGTNWLISTPITVELIGLVNSYQIVCAKPIITTNFNVITFSLYDKAGIPVRYNTELTITLTLNFTEKCC